MTREHLAAFARTLPPDDHVVIEAIRLHVGRVVIANSRQVRLIAGAHGLDHRDSRGSEQRHAFGLLGNNTAAERDPDYLLQFILNPRFEYREIVSSLLLALPEFRPPLVVECLSTCGSRWTGDPSRINDRF